MSDERVAHCACGNLEARTSGEPVIVSVCHCFDCQRRTGSAFGAGAFFEKSAVHLAHVRSVPKTFTRTVPAGRTVTNHFCGDCGGTLYWEAEGRPGLVGISLGMFDLTRGPPLPPPARSVYEDRKHPWFSFDVTLEHMA